MKHNNQLPEIPNNGRNVEREPYWLYVSSPYSKGDVDLNVLAALRVYHDVLSYAPGIIPYCPLWCHYQEVHDGRAFHYEHWMTIDLELIKRFDGVLRVDAEYNDYLQTESSGAQREVDMAYDLNKDVFFSLEEVLNHVFGDTRPEPVHSERICRVV